jgi:hypothetical protein
MFLDRGFYIILIMGKAVGVCLTITVGMSIGVYTATVVSMVVGLYTDIYRHDNRHNFCQY